MHHGFFKTACLSAALAVALGAMGAHYFKDRITPEALQAFETGVRFQFYHVFALLAVSLVYAHHPGKRLLMAGRLFLAGTLLFSGSLYLLALTDINRLIGIITPFGGVSFIAGWLFLFAALRQKD